MTGPGKVNRPENVEIFLKCNNLNRKIPENLWTKSKSITIIIKELSQLCGWAIGLDGTEYVKSHDYVSILNNAHVDSNVNISNDNYRRMDSWFWFISFW